jgi:hypothetical protein
MDLGMLLSGDHQQSQKLIDTIIKTTVALADIDIKKMNDQQAEARLKELVPDLIAVNKWPDFVEDKGHMFGTTLPDSDKRALIELLKTF